MKKEGLVNLSLTGRIEDKRETTIKLVKWMTEPGVSWMVKRHIRRTRKDRKCGEP